MSISLQLEPHATHLLARVAGPFALDEAKSVSQRFIEASVEHRLSNILVDVRQVQGQLTVAERYLYSEFVAREVVGLAVRLGFPPIRLAYVGHAPIIDPARFGVVVARNRGAEVLATEDLAEALAWLGAEQT